MTSPTIDDFFHLFVVPRLPHGNNMNVYKRCLPRTFSPALSRKFQIIGFHRNAALTSLLETREQGATPRSEILKVLQAVAQTKADGKVSPGGFTFFLLLLFSPSGSGRRRRGLRVASYGARKPCLRDASFYSRDSLIAASSPPSPCSFDHNYLKREKF